MQIFQEQFMICPTSEVQVSSWNTISPSASDDVWDIPSSLTTTSTSSFDSDGDENASVQSTFTISNSGTFSWPSRDLTSTQASSSVQSNRQPLPQESTKRRKVFGDRTNNAPTLRSNHQNSRTNSHQ